MLRNASSQARKALAGTGCERNVTRQQGIEDGGNSTAAAASQRTAKMRTVHLATAHNKVCKEVLSTGLL